VHDGGWVSSTSSDTDSHASGVETSEMCSAASRGCVVSIGDGIEERRGMGLTKR